MIHEDLFENQYQQECEKQEVEISTKVFLFVYGSLRRKMYNHYLLERNSLLITKGILRGHSLYSLGSYPAIKESPNHSDYVVGELYDINSKKTFMKIDMMELLTGYHRKRVKISDCKGEEFEAIVYVFNRDCTNLPKVADGDWVEYIKKRDTNE